MTAARRLALALLLGLAAALPAAARAEGEPPAPPKRAPEEPAKPAEPAKPEPPKETDVQVLERITGEMAKKVEEIRGLKFKHPVKRVWKSREEARLEMIANIDEEIPPAKQAGYSAMLGFFGFTKEGATVKEVISDFIAAGAGGYYNPKTDLFSLIRGFNEDASRGIVFHELVHAVEDQYYDFQQRSERYEKEELDDQAEALRALVEGSARVHEQRFVDSEPDGWPKYMQGQMAEAQQGDTLKKQMAIPPAVLLAFVLYPYGNGSAFLEQVLPKDGDGKGDPVGTLFADPPTSTEQILHPSKYLGERDLPRGVALPDLAPSLGAGWSRLAHGTMGELWTGIALNAYLVPNNLMAQVQSCLRLPKGPFKSQDEGIKFQLNLTLEFKGQTAKAAGGWDGDRYALFGAGDRVALAWVSVWDGEDDAREFAEAYGKVLVKKYRVKAPAPPSTPQPTGEAGAKPAEAPPPAPEWKDPPSEPLEGGTRWRATRDGESAIVVRGERVIVLERVPGDRIPALLVALGKVEVVRDPKDAVPAPPK